MKKYFFLLLLFLATGNLFAQFTPSKTIQSPDYRYTVKTWDYVQPGGFQPYRAKIKVEVFDAPTGKRLNKIIVRDARSVKSLSFVEEGKELLMLVENGSGTSEAIKVDFDAFRLGIKRYIVSR
jgi:hypothetical protein